MAKDKQDQPFWGENMNTFNTGKNPWLDNESLLSSYRKNMELMNATHQIVAETTKSLMELQTQYMKNAFEQLSEQSKQCLSMGNPQDKASKHSEMAKDTIDQAVEHAREISTIIAKSNDKIIEGIKKSAKEGLEEAVSMAKKTTKGK